MCVGRTVASGGTRMLKGKNNNRNLGTHAPVQVAIQNSTVFIFSPPERLDVILLEKAAFQSVFLCCVLRSVARLG